MENRILTLILVGAVAVGVGISILSQQARDPFLQGLIMQQVEILKAQQRMERKLGAGPADKAMPSGIGGSAQVQALEQRIATLEAQLKTIQEGNIAPQLPPGPPPEDFTTVHEIPVAHTPIIGDKKAQVTIVEFVDFQCPFCANFYGPMAEAVEAADGKANYMVKNYPLSFHPQARPAAKAAFAAGEQGKYAEMAKALLENHTNLSEETFKKLAKEIGLNANRFWKDYQGKDTQWEQYIQDDIDLGNKVGVQGTPTFYINGRKTNARDVDSWKREIDAALAE